MSPRTPHPCARARAPQVGAASSAPPSAAVSCGVPGGCARGSRTRHPPARAPSTTALSGPSPQPWLPRWPSATRHPSSPCTVFRLPSHAASATRRPDAAGCRARGTLLLTSASCPAVAAAGQGRAPGGQLASRPGQSPCFFVGPARRGLAAPGRPGRGHDRPRRRRAGQGRRSGRRGVRHRRPRRRARGRPAGPDRREGLGEFPRRHRPHPGGRSAVGAGGPAAGTADLAPYTAASRPRGAAPGGAARGVGPARGAAAGRRRRLRRRRVRGGDR